MWLRKAHGWIGLWGAVLGLLFGISGIWLNHRNLLKLPQEQQRSQTRLVLPQPAPSSAQALADWARQALQLAVAASPTVKVEPARPAPWSEGAADAAGAMQPERWTVSFAGPRRTVQVEHWVGQRVASVRTTDNGLLATLTSLHKGTGMPVAWALLVDTLAGSLILLSLSGVSLWMLTRRRRVWGVATVALAAVSAVALVGPYL